MIDQLNYSEFEKYLGSLNNMDKNNFLETVTIQNLDRDMIRNGIVVPKLEASAISCRVHHEVEIINDALAWLDDERKALSEIEVRVKRTVLIETLGLSRVKDRKTRLEIVRYLYWSERAPAWALAAALLIDDIPDSVIEDGDETEALRVLVHGRNHMLLKMVGPAGFVKCSSCSNGRYYIRSRTSLYSDRHGYCDECIEKSRVASSYDHAKHLKWLKERDERYKREEDELSQLSSAHSLDEEKLIRLYQLISSIRYRSTD